MNNIEKLIQELQEDSSELYHKDRIKEKKRNLLFSSKQVRGVYV